MVSDVMKLVLTSCLLELCQGHIRHLLSQSAIPKIASSITPDHGPSPRYTTSVFDSAPKDGVVSRSEMTKEFSCYDTNVDGAISRCEWTNRQTEFWGQEVTTGGELFNMMDGNLDDQITLEEFQHMLDTADTIKTDGVVTDSEFTACWEKMLRTARRMAGMPTPPVKYSCARNPEERKLSLNFPQFLEDIDRNYDHHVQMVEGDPIADHAIFDLSAWIGMATARYNLTGVAAFAVYQLLDLDMSGDLSREDFANNHLDKDLDGQVSICELWGHVSTVAKLADDYAVVLASQNKIVYKLLYGLEYVTPVRQRTCGDKPFCLKPPSVGGTLQDHFREHARLHQEIVQSISQNPYFQQRVRGHTECEAGEPTDIPHDPVKPAQVVNGKQGEGQSQGQGQDPKPTKNQQQQQGESEKEDRKPVDLDSTSNIDFGGEQVETIDEGQEDYEPDLSGLEVRGFFKIEG